MPKPRIIHRVSHPKPAAEPDKLLTLKIVADRLGRSHRAVQMMVKRKQIEVIRTGRRVHVSEAYLNKLLKKHTHPTTGKPL